MRNATKILILTVFLTICCTFVLAEAQNLKSTLKIKAAVLELSDSNGEGTIVNRSNSGHYTIPGGWLDTLLTFQNMNLSRDTIGTSARSNIEFEFYNPVAMPQYADYENFAGNENINPTNFYNDQRNNPVYWLLPSDCVTERALSQLDVLLVPYKAGDVYQLVSLNKIVKDWVAKGGILWYDTDNPTKEFPIDLTPIVKLSFGKAASSTSISSTSPILDYPYYLDMKNIKNLSEGSILQTGTVGLEHSISSVTLNNGKPSYSIVKAGNGKVIFTFGSLTGKINSGAGDDFIKAAFNQFYYALGSDSGSAGRLTSLLGDTLTFNSAFAGQAKPIIDANRVIYTMEEPGYYGVYIEGERLINGDAPDKNKKLSKPAVLGENDIIVYDEDGVVYLYAGITYNTAGMNIGSGAWLRIYEPDEAEGLAEVDSYANTNYAPIVRDNWVYYVDSYARLHCIYTMDLKSGEAQHTWVTKSFDSNNMELLSNPIMINKIESNGSYVTEIDWIARNTINETNQPMFVSVPVFVENEVSKQQPINTNTAEIKADLMTYPTWQDKKPAFYKSDDDKYMVDVVCQYDVDGSLPAELYSLTLDKDYKINAQNTITLETKTAKDSDTGVSYTAMSDSSDLVKNESKLKDVRLSDMKFILSYVPKYTVGIRTTSGFRQFYLQETVLEESEGGLVTKLGTYDVDDSSNTDKQRYIVKYFNNDMLTSNTKQNFRESQWSYLVHSGYKEIKLPDGTGNYEGSLKSEINWDFPYGTDESFAAITYMSNPICVNDKVYFTATATIDGNNRTALICLKSNPSSKLRIVDEKGNPVCLYTNKKNADNNWVADKTYSVKIYQPDPQNKDQGPNIILFDARNSSTQLGVDNGQGTITMSRNYGLRKLKDDGEKINMMPYGGVTTALPVFIQVDGKFLPIKNDTYPFIPEQYNEKNDSNLLNVWDPESDSNKDKKLYVDMSEWQSMSWYSILPGNTVGSVSPIVSGDKVIVFAETRDENSDFVHNAVYTVNPKNNTAAGIKITDITTSALPDSLYVVNENKSGAPKVGAPAVGSNLIAMPTTVSGSAGIALFENSRTLVADNNKILEIDGSGKAVWRLTNPEMFVRNGSGWSLSNFTLNNPVKVRYQSDDNFNNRSTVIVADAGRKAIMFFNRAGVVKSTKQNGNYYSWYFDSFADQYGLMPSGQSSELSNISDFQLWTEKLSDGYKYHITVADSGNKRIVDLTFIERFDGTLDQCVLSDSGVIQPYLNWLCYDSFTDKKFKFTSVEVSDVVRDPVAGKDIRLVVAGVANFNAAERNGLKKSKGGSVLLYSYDLLDNNDTVNRYGKAIDGIGKKSDTIGIPATLGDMMEFNISDMILPNISGLKKAVITGYHFNQGSESTDMSHIGIAVLDDSGVVEYVVARDGSNKPKTNPDGTYQWKARRFVSAAFFGVNHTDADKLTRGSKLTENFSKLTFPGRVRAFSTDYYARENFASGFSKGSNTIYQNDWMPLKAPVVPMDMRVLANGNWLVTNGYTGDLTYRYKNPYDGNVYLAKGKYSGEVFEVEFQDVYDGSGASQEWWSPRLVWSNANIESYNVDDYLPGITVSPSAAWFSDLNDQIAFWNRNVEEMDGVIYPDSNVAENGAVSQPGSLGNIVGGWRYSGAKMTFPKSADR